jgi:hypothetical protein
MAKYQNVKDHLLTDETLAKRIQEQQEFQKEAERHGDTLGVQMHQERIMKMSGHLKSRSK